MTVPNRGIPQPRSETEGINRRRHGRVLVKGFRSSLGDIMDISRSGVRVRATAPLPLKQGQQIAVILETPLGTAEVVACVVWQKKAGWLKYECGLEFVDITPEARAAIANLASVPNEHG
jgi:hypothetical protein